MDYFAGALQDACRAELAARDATAVATLTGPSPPPPSSPITLLTPRAGLLAYPLMRTAGCLASTAANTYCYLAAAASPAPADLYAFSLALGAPLPPASAPSCDACGRSLFALYAGALSAASSTAAGGALATATAGAGVNATGAAVVAGRYDALRAVYPAAAKAAQAACGTDYVPTVAAASAARARGPPGARGLLGALGAVGLVGVLGAGW